MHLVVFAPVWVGAYAGKESVAGIPIGGEERAVTVHDRGVVMARGVGHRSRFGVWLGVLAQAAVDVDTDCSALSAVRGLGGEIFGVDAAHDVEAMAMVGGHEDQCIVEGSESGEVRDRSFDGVI